MLTSGQVVELTAHDLDQIAAILTQAFIEDPLIRHVLNDHNEDYQQILHALFLTNCQHRLVHHNVQIIGYREGAPLVGVAVISPPDVPLMHEDRHINDNGLLNRLSATETQLFTAHEHVIEQYRPSIPHMYLVLLGVHPEKRGRGYGAALLRTMHDLSAMHPTSQGVYLDTQNAVNVPMYQHFGYQILGYEQSGPVGTWCLFRANAVECCERDDVIKSDLAMEGRRENVQ
ncbi:MAG: GNAT family N-acetyltransferase [Chloroflexaceae bacterium]|nr:GNAT family N-acetyltransferase [Chloroflexaceae bacterium]